MSYATSAPGQGSTASTAPPICQNCQTSTTPLWRRDEGGSVLCNACGLFLKLHGRARPISLKTDVIKSRNRVKSGQNGPQKKKSSVAGHDALDSPQHQTARLPSMSQVQVSDADDRHDLSHSRPGTPGGLHVGGHSHPHPANIAPPHMFDAVTLDGSADRTIDHSYANSPYYAQARHGDPSPLAILSGAAQSSQHMDGHAQPSTSLSTRVSELEVINNLFRDRVAHLENIEHDLRRQLDEASLREQNLRRIIEELQPRYEPPIDPAERQLKRLRSEFINDDSEIVDHGHVRDDRDGHAESLPPIRETLAPS